MTELELQQYLLRAMRSYTKDMNPTFSTPWDSFVLVLPKLKIDGVEGVYISSDDVTDYGGQTGGQTSGQTREILPRCQCCCQDVSERCLARFWHSLFSVARQKCGLYKYN